MPKELNLSPNERIDFDDFEYGSTTFTVDSLRAHVTRLLSGGYRGGFVLEGFRIVIPPPGASDLYVTVYNGIAIDRGGRLITKEGTDHFLNNSRDNQDAILLENSPKNYLMLEYTLDPVDYKERSFWDPTHVNSAIKDSSGDDIPQPRGKEFETEIPTRKAQSSTIIVSGTGFEDATDSNKIRIPLAIIPIDTAAIAIDLSSSDYTSPQTSIIEKPKSKDASGGLIDIEYIQCANTRTFDDTGKIEIKRRDNTVRDFIVGGGGGVVQEIEFIQNDRENNILWLPAGIRVDSAPGPSGFPAEVPEITDIVTERLTGTGDTPANILDEASKWDCRPMFFSVTEKYGSREEDPNAWPLDTDGVGRTDSRQFKYWSGLSLIGDPNPLSASFHYPVSSAYGQQKIIPMHPTRIETRIKQQQDFFRVLASLIEEMKYGYAEPIRGSWSNDVAGSSILAALGLEDSVGNEYLIDTTRYFSKDYEGANIFILEGAVGNVNTRGSISKVYGEHVCKIAGFPQPFVATNKYEIELNYPTSLHQYVDAIEIGSLKEVYNARIDQFTDTYAEDLNRRLSMNKVATITVGDGINTHGDYIGNDGLKAALKQAYAYKRGATIYVREGSYSLDEKILVGPHTTIIGDGPNRTQITLGSGDVADPIYFELRDYLGNYTDVTKNYDDIKCESIYFKDLSITSAKDYPCISNATLEFQDSPGSSAVVAPGIFVPVTSTNLASLVSDFKLENVTLEGGGRGEWIAANDGNDTIYMVYLVSSETKNLNHINEDIKFTKCNFKPKGGGLILKSCKNVSFEGCTFSSIHEPPADRVSEGITFSSRADKANQIYNGVSINNTDMNVSISDCTFKGIFHLEGASSDYPSDGRGWINFTPNYLGQNIKIEGCKFIGDLEGTAATDSTSPRPDKRGLSVTAYGRCIVSSFPFDVLVSNCLFHTYHTAVLSQYGLVKLSGCNFWNCTKAVHADGEFAQSGNKANNYTYFSDGVATSAASNFWKVNGHFYYRNNLNYFRIDINGCNIDACYQGIYIGVGSVGNTSTSYDTLRSYIKVNSSSFWETHYPIDYNLLSGNSAYIDFEENTWQLIEVTDCNIIGALLAIRGSDSDYAGIEDDTAVYSARKFYIKDFNYKNNNHFKTELDLNYYSPFDEGHDGGYVFVCADTINVSGNNFTDFTVDPSTGSVSDRNPIIYIAAGRQTNCSLNVFQDCLVRTSTTHRQLTAIEIGLTASYHDSTTVGISETFRRGPKLVINGNIISNEILHSTNNRLINGVYITHRVRNVVLPKTNGILTGGPHIQPWLEFCDNDFNLINGNFGLLAVQHNGYSDPSTPTTGDFDSGYANFWEWFNVSVKNNSIRIDIDAGVATAMHQMHGNDLTSELTVLPITINSVYEAAGGTNGGAFVLVPQTYGTGSVDQRTLRFNFLGGACTQAVVPLPNSPDYFIACVDLRRCYFGDGSTSTRKYRKNVVDVLNNVFSINRDSSVGSSTEDLHELMGLRISKFPPVFTVKNNTFDRAPLYAKWSWNNPWHESSVVVANTLTPVIGFTMDVVSNTFTTHTVHACVDINPATGFGHGGDNASGAIPAARPANMHGYANINFCENTVEGTGDGVLRGTSADPELYWPYQNVVRLWHPNYRSWCTNMTTPVGAIPIAVPDGTGATCVGIFNYGPDSVTEWYQSIGGFGVQQNFAKFVWNVASNHMVDSIFKITEMLQGGAVAQGVVLPHTQNTELQRQGNTGAGTVIPYDPLEPYWQFMYFYDNSFVMKEGLDISGAAAAWPGLATGSTFDIEFSIFGTVFASNGGSSDYYLLEFTTEWVRGGQDAQGDGNPTSRVLHCRDNRAIALNDETAVDASFRYRDIHLARNLGNYFAQG